MRVNLFSLVKTTIGIFNSNDKIGGKSVSVSGAVGRVILGAHGVAGLLGEAVRPCESERRITALLRSSTYSINLTQLRQRGS